MRDYRIYLKDIVAAIGSTERFIIGLDFDAFKADDRTASAVTRKLKVMREEVKQIPATRETQGQTFGRYLIALSTSKGRTARECRTEDRPTAVWILTCSKELNPHAQRSWTPAPLGTEQKIARSGLMPLQVLPSGHHPRRLAA